MNDRIKQLNAEIEKEKQKINNCNHSFDKPFYNPEFVREPYGFKTVGQGSDVWTEPQGYTDVVKPRWTKVCKICGFNQHTYKEKPIKSVGTEPDFD